MKKQLMQCERGGVLILLAISLMVLFLAGAVAVDMARFQTARAKFSTCVDNAGLAALSKISAVPTGVPAQTYAAQIANTYYQANCQAGYGSTAPVTIMPSNVAVANDDNSVTIDLATTMPTTMMNVVGINTLTINAHSVVARSNNNGLELALVLDNTGSMKLYPDATQGIASGGTCVNSATGTSFTSSQQGSRMCALQAASENLINILFGVTNVTAPSNMWVGIVPFAQAVNIGGADPTVCGAAGAACTQKQTTPSYSDNFGSFPITSMLQTTTSSQVDFGPVSGSATYTDCPNQDLNGNALINSGPANGNNPAFCTYQTTDPVNKPVTFGLVNWNGCVGQRPSWNNSWWSWNDTIDANPQWGPPLFPAYMAPAYEQFTQTTSGVNFPTPQTFDWSAKVNSGTTNNQTALMDPTISVASGVGGGLNDLFPQFSPSPVTGLMYGDLTPAYAQALANNWKTVNTTTNQTTYYLPLNNAAVGSASTPQGPNVYCTSPVTPMTNQKTDLMTALNNMYPNGQTILAAGLNWGMNMISPNWNGVWSGKYMAANNLPKPYSTFGNIKAVVFMTDGYDFFFPGSYTAYGTLADGQLIGSNSSFSTYNNQIYDEGGADTELDMRFYDNCQRLNWYGVLVFTVGLGQTDGVYVQPTNGAPTDVNGPLLQACASNSNDYFFANNAATLNADFEQIAQLLSNLRVAQ